ncbi:hypothetical protein CES85_0677 [Ochrobactrum quorumnocens]|jgi:hypothetical protein|uniref:Uncharacterized protein n=5 Tax=Brucella/Ochrobactrum group TaxID=2826938 RepID=A0A256GH57_9HYPH|nr:hypothetical protein [Brucella pseudogrignonensis]ASV86075.1 hypothetical protein CES85_0677 [[Ochrobactrum] quorumnocens]OYR11107.1 hypothetical protein CEV33_2575 [Brucella grignonensis]OYR19466.1 hypothetical protein CEV31_1872 [Brucella thiophenivorans]OYR26487.1 hypothetical protein CEV34_2361 [Brucella pseudogrignonensis]
MFISDLQSKLKMGLGILIWLKDNLSPSPDEKVAPKRSFFWM